MKIRSLLTNRIANPLGFDLGEPSLSWVAEDTAGKRQRWARVEVAADPDFARVLMDTGEDASLSSLDVRVRFPLQPCTRYYWRVTVCADNGDTAVSPTAWFETARLGEPWHGKWITPSFSGNAPLMRRSFTLAKKPACARGYFTGLGLYELYINGKKAGDEYLSPNCTAYDKWLQYQTYDVTELLQEGENTVGVLLGNGWARGRFGFDPDELPDYETGALGMPSEIFTDRFLLLGEIIADGAAAVVTDETWQCAPSPIDYSGIYDGERYDQRREIPRWDLPAGDSFAWQPVTVTPKPETIAEPEPRLSLPVKCVERRKPTLLITPKGEKVLDLGQVMTGWVEMDLCVPRGRQVRLQFCELLQEGCFYRDNLRSALAEYRFLSDGRPAHVRPHFTFYGFRYVKVEGLEEVDPSKFTCCVLSSELRQTGTIETGNPKIDRLFLNSLWGQRGNFVDVPTDCPQRDERMGWTGDAQVFCSTAGFHMDCYAFYTKFCRDIYEEQKQLEGAVPDVAPIMVRSRFHPEYRGMGSASCGWADAGTVIPWMTYLYSGNRKILETGYNGMRDWVEWVHRSEEGPDGLWMAVRFHYGDWLALDGARSGFDPEYTLGGTDLTFLCSAYYYYSQTLVAKAAKVLGRTEDQRLYEARAARTLQAIRREFFTPTGRCAERTQTGLAMSLFFGLCEEQHREKILAALKEKLALNKNYLQTGFLGTPCLSRALSDNGANDLAYTLLLNEEYPSWLYEVNMGATTVWERWNSVLPDGKISGTGMNSMNHYAYGAVMEWVYRNVLGVRPREEAPGFREIDLKPQPDSRIGRAALRFDSPSGLYTSAWETAGDGFAYDFTVPFGCTAYLTMQNVSLEALTVNGIPAKNADVNARPCENGVCATLPAGSYHIV